MSAVHSDGWLADCMPSTVLVPERSSFSTYVVYTELTWSASKKSSEHCVDVCLGPKNGSVYTSGTQRLKCKLESKKWQCLHVGNPTAKIR